MCSPEVLVHRTKLETLMGAAEAAVQTRVRRIADGECAPVVTLMSAAAEASTAADHALLLSATGVRAGYGALDVLHDVSLRLAPGEMIGLIGTNGCGKSTLLRALTGLLPLRAGEVELLRRPLALYRRDEQARVVAVVAQANPLLFSFSVREAVEMGRYAFAGSLRPLAAADHARVAEALALADVIALADRPVDELSGGEFQRVMLARALAQRTRVLLLDEPTTHLDLQHRFHFASLLARLCREENLGVVCVLHDLNLAAEFCTRLVLMHEGRVIADAAPEKVLVGSLIECAFGLAVPVVPNPYSGRPMIAWRRDA